MKSYLLPWTLLAPSLRHSLFTFESLLERGDIRNLALCILGLVLGWHLYTPIHELLHAGACILGGGTVTELAIKPQYGGTLLKHIFPFVVADSEYAGQLTGFTTPNDLVYAFVDLAPYSLSIVGISLMEWCRRRGSALVFGLAMLLAYIPFMSLVGDYYELASLATTRLVGPDMDPRMLVSDDFFKLVGQLHQNGQLSPRIVLLLLLGLLAAFYAILLTLAAQVLLARRIFGYEVLTPASATTSGKRETRDQTQ